MHLNYITVFVTVNTSPTTFKTKCNFLVHFGKQTIPIILNRFRITQIQSNHYIMTTSQYTIVVVNIHNKRFVAINTFCVFTNSQFNVPCRFIDTLQTLLNFCYLIRQICQRHINFITYVIQVPTLQCFY